MGVDISALCFSIMFRGEDLNRCYQRRLTCLDYNAQIIHNFLTHSNVVKNIVIYMPPKDFLREYSADV